MSKDNIESEVLRSKLPEDIKNILKSPGSGQVKLGRMHLLPNYSPTLKTHHCKSSSGGSGSGSGSSNSKEKEGKEEEEEEEDRDLPGSTFETAQEEGDGNDEIDQDLYLLSTGEMNIEEILERRKNTPSSDKKL